MDLRMCLFRRGEGGGYPQIACTERLCPKGVPKFSGFRLYEKEGVSLVEVH